MIGTSIGQYRIESQLGAGGMGVVYRAFDSRLERHVAIKVFPDLATSPKARSRLLHEARSASALNHPNVCTVHEVGESGDITYLVMEFVEGRNAHGVDSAGRIPRRDHRRLWVADRRCARACPRARRRAPRSQVRQRGRHAGGPAQGARLRPRPAAGPGGRDRDGRSQDDSLFAPGRISGTLAYMAPEALSGAMVDGRADIWALGVMLYEMASGRRPFTGQTTFELSGQILHEAPPPLPERVPPGLSAVVTHCLTKDPGRRYQDAREVRAALHALGSGTPHCPRRQRPFVETHGEEIDPRVALHQSVGRSGKRLLRRWPDRGDHLGPLGRAPAAGDFEHVEHAVQGHQVDGGGIGPAAESASTCSRAVCGASAMPCGSTPS